MDVKNSIAIVSDSWIGLEELEQFSAIVDRYSITLFGSETCLSYIKENLPLEEITMVSLPVYPDNQTFLPGLEEKLQGFTTVLLKGRSGIFAYQVVKAKRTFQFELLVWEDNARSFPGEGNPELQSLQKEVDQQADGYLVQSRLVEKTLRREGISKEKIHYIHPVVYRKAERKHTFSFDVIFASFGIAPSDWVVYFLGIMGWESQWQELIEAVKLLHTEFTSNGKRIKVVFSGPHFPPEMLHAVSIRKLDESILFVLASLETHEALLSRCQAIFTIAGASQHRVEGNPFPFLLAMKNGIPVISSRSPLVEETVGKHRIDYCSGSPESLARAIKKSIEAKGILQDIARKNQEKGFSREQATEGLIRLIEQKRVKSEKRHHIPSFATEEWIQPAPYETELRKKEASK